MKILRVMILGSTLIGCVLGLTACGQKGPLYYPVKPVQATQSVLEIEKSATP